MSVLPQHKTDDIFRVENVDRYDDRDVIITNLLETYDRLVAFGHKHLSDPFVQEGLHSVSARDKILREIFSNSLAHRDYSSGYVAKFVIEKEKMFTENANRAHGNGALNLSNFEPHTKNPAISKVFREISLADELGSGMRNTYKYTKLYSGGEPEFIEGDVFRTVVPLNDVSVGIVGPKNNGAATDATTDTATDTTTDGIPSREQLLKKIIELCETPRSRDELMQQCGLVNKSNFMKSYIKPLLSDGKIKMTIPDKPSSKNQKYIKS